MASTETLAGPDRYAVFGNPISHSRSPAIHRMFASQTGQAISYEKRLAPLDGFAAAVDAYRLEGGRGCNVTVPFKLDAARYATALSQRARAAGAVNTLRFDADGGCYGDNTDGAGLVADLTQRLGLDLAGARVALLGAGGAARGVVLPLLDAGVESLLIVNRTAARALELASLAGDARVVGAGLDALGEATASVVINATSAGLDGSALALPASLWDRVELAYDMVYGRKPTAFMCEATQRACPRVADGLGMLVEQAAESFLLWRGVRPQTAPVYQALRVAIDAGH
ncbi:MAG: shikimate dehydrogenase [Burkholderiaceae bacterium]|nr:shikimate dehydrogenase [Burkholderiaceae bacterium]